MISRQEIDVPFLKSYCLLYFGILLANCHGFACFIDDRSFVCRLSVEAFTCHLPSVKEMLWKFPPCKCMKVNIDAMLKGNLGLSSCGTFFVIDMVTFLGLFLIHLVRFLAFMHNFVGLFLPLSLPLIMVGCIIGSRKIIRPYCLGKLRASNLRHAYIYFLHLHID